MLKKKLFIFLSLVLSIIIFSGCSAKNEKNYFSLWNECNSIATLKAYVEDVTNKDSKNYIPEEDRIATFDMDGTLVGELYPTYFEYNMLEYRILDDPTYKDKASEEEIEVAYNIRDSVRNGTALPSGFDMIHAYAAAKAYSGFTLAEFDEYVSDYALNTPNGFKGMTYAESFYKPMLEILAYLKDYNFTSYVVSGSDRFICRTLCKDYGIEENRVIGMDVVLKAKNQGEENGVKYTYTLEDDVVRTDELIIKNLKTNKVKQIAQEIGKVPVLSFGNSSGDSAMHNYCLANDKYKSEAFMLVADDNVRDHAKLEEGEKRRKTWVESGYNVISMKNDFKTIYGDGVEMTDFVFE